jgi:hypothetical protein
MLKTESLPDFNYTVKHIGLKTPNSGLSEKIQNIIVRNQIDKLIGTKRNLCDEQRCATPSTIMSER